MALALRDVLADPTVASSDPVVLAGHDRLSTPVRWVHTSEVLDIAGLLRGGELLLVGGASLAEASEEVRRRYVAELAERGVAALALETGTRLPQVPPEMVDEARQRGLPLVELHAVVRFVEVTQAINSGLINESVRRLQLADQVSHALAAGLADGADLAGLAAVLAKVAHADVRLTSPSGELIAEAVLDPESPTAAVGAVGAVGEVSAVGAVGPVGVVAAVGAVAAVDALTATVSSAGVTVAILSLIPRIDSDLVMLQAARDRAPEALGLALLRWRPLSQVERDTHEFLTTVVRGSGSPRRLHDLAEQLRIRDHPAWAGVVGRIGDDQRAAAAIDAALRRGGRRAVSEVTQDRYAAVVAFERDGDTLASARQRLVQDLRDTPLHPQVRIAVGPGSREVAAVGRCLREAERALELVDAGESEGVVDAAAMAVPRLLATIDRQGLVAELVEEQLGDLLAQDRRRGSDLFETLSAYLRHSCRKTETAAALHLQRQSLYQRLDRIMALLGRPETTSDRWAAITVAVEVERARRRGILPG